MYPPIIVPKKSKMIHWNMWIEESLLNNLRCAAIKNGMNVSELMRGIAKSYINTYEATSCNKKENSQ